MKKNFIKKLLIGGLITSLSLCCCFLNFNKNVSASAINEFQDENKWFENATSLPSNFNDINDLKGKTFTIEPYVLFFIKELIEFDVYINILERDYIGIEIDEDTHETIQCVDYLQYPYVIYERFDTENLYDFSLFSLYQESSSNYSCFYLNDVALNGESNLQFNGSVVSYNNNFAYLPVNDIIERNDVPLGLNSVTTIDSSLYYLNYSNYDFLTESDFLDNIDLYDIEYQYLNFYLIFPNTDRYSLVLNPSDYLLAFQFFSYIQPYNANINDRQIRYNEGYNDGYYVGQRDALDNTYRLPFLTGIFNAINDILALEIFPNVRLGYFVLIPLALGVTGMIFWFWRKD